MTGKGDGIRDGIDGAEPVDIAEGRRTKRAGGGAAPGMPENCPVTALGRDADGKTFHYLNADKMLVALAAREHTQQGLVALFGAEQEYLDEHFEKRKRGEGVTLDVPKLTRALMAACSKRGTFNPSRHVRGCGAWLGVDGELIYHAGDWVWFDNARRDPGLYDGFVYPARSPIPLPHAKAGVGPDAVLDLFEVLTSWNWRRGAREDHLDARLMLGWLQLAPFGGALQWRPQAWVTGEAAYGKSTLQGLCKALLGDGILTSTDPTKMALANEINNSAVPVALDELEAKAARGRVDDLIEFMRHAGSGGEITRSSASQGVFRFEVRSMFLASSILVPPLKNQDLGRFVLLDLKRFEGAGREPDLSPARWRETGKIMLRRFLDNWHRWPAVFEAYRSALIAVGHGDRGSKQYGALLAAADIGMSDTALSADKIAELCEGLAPDKLVELSATAESWRQCLDWLSQAAVDPWRSGERVTVIELVRDEMLSLDPVSSTSLNKSLERIGLKIVEREGKRFLAVSTGHNGLAEIFKTTDWRKEPSSRFSGWYQALRRAPDAQEPPSNLRFFGMPSKCVLIPIELVYDDSPRAP